MAATVETVVLFQPASDSSDTAFSKSRSRVARLVGRSSSGGPAGPLAGRATLDGGFPARGRLGCQAALVRPAHERYLQGDGTHRGILGHGQDIADAVGIIREPSDRLHHLAHLVVRNRDFAFKNNKPGVPESEFRVELAGPSGKIWSWGPEEAGEKTSGVAETGAAA